MKNICTVSDINYLTKGLALLDSLCKHTKDVVLHYLCIDKESYETLKKHESDRLIVYNVNDYLESDNNLLRLKNSEYKYFCWSLASYFTNKLLTSGNYYEITYIDSDIYFHKSFDLILDEIGEKSVGMFRHRQFSLDSNRPEGAFNVGVVYFKASKVGLHLCNWWADAVLNKKYPKYATCGDQKYLEYFVSLEVSKEEVYVDENIGHGAPWLWHIYELIGNGDIMWEGNKQPLIFTHFSQFVDNGNSYTPSTMHHIYTPLAEYTNNKQLKMIYDEYHEALQNIKNKYKV